ncbi:hypothetical protein ACULNC_13510 [Shigella flexneri]
MPHPERVFRTVSNSWHPENWARMAHGCAFSAMRVSSWVSHQFIGFAAGCGIYAASGIKHQPLS